MQGGNFSRRFLSRKPRKWIGAIGKCCRPALALFRRLKFVRGTNFETARRSPIDSGSPSCELSRAAQAADRVGGRRPFSAGAWQ